MVASGEDVQRCSNLGGQVEEGGVVHGDGMEVFGLKEMGAPLSAARCAPDAQKRGVLGAPFGIGFTGFGE